jgi:hypothetical protein
MLSKIKSKLLRNFCQYVLTKKSIGNVIVQTLMVMVKAIVDTIMIVLYQLTENCSMTALKRLSRRFMIGAVNLYIK